MVLGITRAVVKAARFNAAKFLGETKTLRVVLFKADDGTKVIKSFDKKLEM